MNNPTILKNILRDVSQGAYIVFEMSSELMQTLKCRLLSGGQNNMS